MMSAAIHRQSRRLIGTGGVAPRSALGSSIASIEPTTRSGTRLVTTHELSPPIEYVTWTGGRSNSPSSQTWSWI
jgi:hypothetical protein